MRLYHKLYLRLLLLVVLCLSLYGLYNYFWSDIYFDDQNIFIHIEPLNFSGFSIDNKLFQKNLKLCFPKTNPKIRQEYPYGILPSNESDRTDERIYNQMSYIPPRYTHHKEKVILVFDYKDYLNFGKFQDCPVSKCRYTTNVTISPIADVILWFGGIKLPTHQRPKYQAWAILFLESPKHTPNFRDLEHKAKSMINWTITYRPDSTIPYPYLKYSPYDLINPSPKKYPLPITNFALGKKKMAAWFVSNCRPSNDRMEVVTELQKYIQVDVYGKCGTLSCKRSNESSCFEMLNRDYKFYLAFENSYCRHYITEKFLRHGLSNNVIPIVLGAHTDDYKRVSPPHSYIHVDDFNTISELAEYLKYLDKNDTAFNEYFAWKPYGTVDFQHYLPCRLCMIAHLGDEVKTFYTNISQWWHGQNDNMCFESGKWKDHNN